MTTTLRKPCVCALQSPLKLYQCLDILPLVYQAMGFYLYKKYISCMEIKNAKMGDRGREY